MRGKRSKQYRKLMHQYGMTFGFREPYQVLVDAQMVQDAARFKMDLWPALERTLHGKVKPMITQCSMRHLYASKETPPAIVDKTKTYERRRCNHHTLEQPLSTLECLSSVVDPKGSRTNKHRYVVACQDNEVRSYLRSIPGVPLIYVHRSVMIMEPMAHATEHVRDKDEKSKFRAGLKGARGAITDTLKRKRDDEEEQSGSGSEQEEGRARSGAQSQEEASKKKKRKGPKGPNPLSVKKAKKRPAQENNKGVGKKDSGEGGTSNPAATINEDGTPAAQKRKRKRSHKSGKGADSNGPESEAHDAPSASAEGAGAAEED
ncbi:hypothetical protein L228DRAFT_242561 [Xylona heveae TC161]|uniref:U three protein 23 n=1 Tax=Xylona heveae (strain CBS 132557 / TC161) TaxID=1328760 RepID=A0A165JER1_XYLHT|nr:hypothetical protein L228DRAFT_242561 [Xylona heveae TC161]KZF26141.1 hypothetical protein L228DRAFT_242561 [Xylona heveae TC161]